MPIPDHFAFPRIPPYPSLAQIGQYTHKLQTISLNTLKINFFIHMPLSTPIFTIIYSHSNAETIYSNYQFLQELSKILNAKIISYEFPGYNSKDSRPKRKKIEKAARHIAEHFVAEEKVVYWGRSIGSYFAAIQGSLALQNVVGVIIESGLSSGLEVVCKSVCCGGMDSFQVKKHMSDFTSLIIHGDEDVVVPLRCALKNKENGGAGATLALIKGAGHEDIGYYFQDQLVKEVGAFLKQNNIDIKYNVENKWKKRDGEDQENIVSRMRFV